MVSTGDLDQIHEVKDPNLKNKFTSPQKIREERLRVCVTMIQGDIIGAKVRWIQAVFGDGVA